MNQEEQVAHDYLVSEGLEGITYEPDGNVPPDFVCDGPIAIEVRRLNENLLDGDNTEGLENKTIAVNQSISSVVQEYDRPTPTDAYWLMIHYSRPIGKASSLKKALKKGLDTFEDTKPQTPHRFSVNGNVHVTIIKREKMVNERYRLAINVDEDSGGLVTELYIENIQHCIDEKAGKISQYQQKYGRWWLILIDALAYGVEDAERDEILQGVTKPTCWERVILVSPHTKHKTLEF